LLDSPAERPSGVSPAVSFNDVDRENAGAEPLNQMRWAVAKLVRHQALDLAFEGSNPSRPAKLDGDLRQLKNRMTIATRGN
jgi:hypothetical protein